MERKQKTGMSQLRLIQGMVLLDHTIDLAASAIDSINVRMAEPIPRKVMAEVVDASLRFLIRNNQCSSYSTRIMNSGPSRSSGMVILSANLKRDRVYLQDHISIIDVPLPLAVLRHERN